MGGTADPTTVIITNEAPSKVWSVPDGMEGVSGVEIYTSKKSVK